MAQRLCVAVAWLAACALAGPATPVAETPVPETTPAPSSVETLEEVAPVGQPSEVPDEQAPAAVDVATSPSEPPAASGEPAAAVDSPSEPELETEAVGADEAEDAPTAFPAQAGAVTIRDFSFGPASVTVGVGESVTWRNSGPSEHTATATSGSFDTGTLAEGETASHRFDEAGTFSYICTPHPFMKGTVHVVAQASAEQPSSGDPAATTDSGEVAQTAPAGGGLPRTGGGTGWMLIAGAGLLLIGSAGRGRTRPARR